MPTDAPNTHDEDSDSPTLRQRLHSATGDRHAESQALADRAGDAVGDREAEVAVREAHGDIEPGAENGASERPAPGELASAADAEAVRDGKSD
jgi:hypothetical protein